MAKEKRASWFKLFLHQKPMMDAVDDATLGKAMKAAMAYFETGEITDLAPLENLLFQSMKVYADEAVEDYARDIANGKKGGRPSTKPPVTDPNPPLASLTQAEAEADADTEADAEADAEAEAEADAEAEAEAEAEEEAKADKEAMDNNNNKGAGRAQTACDFIPPSAQEVMDYCVQEGIYMNIPRFMDYHNATGWRRGNYRVTDWRPLVSYWLDGQAQLERQGRLNC